MTSLEERIDVRLYECGIEQIIAEVSSDIECSCMLEKAPKQWKIQIFTLSELEPNSNGALWGKLSITRRLGAMRV